MSNDVTKAAGFFIRVCLEHRRLFPLRNILIFTGGFDEADDEDRFIAAVEVVLEGYRIGEDIEGMDGALREDFGSLL